MPSPKPEIQIMEPLYENGCLQPGDEVLIDDSPFDASVAPYLSLEDEKVAAEASMDDGSEHPALKRDDRVRLMKLFLSQLFHNHRLDRLVKPIRLTLIGRDEISEQNLFSAWISFIVKRIEFLTKRHRRRFAVRFIVGNASWYKYLANFCSHNVLVTYFPRESDEASHLCTRLGALLDTDAVIAFTGGRMTSIEEDMAAEAEIPSFRVGP